MPVGGTVYGVYMSVGGALSSGCVPVGGTVTSMFVCL